MNHNISLERTRKLGVFILDIIIYITSYILSFLIRYQFSIPEINFQAFLKATPFIGLIFGLLYILTGMYSLYNKRKNELLSSIIINQLLMVIITTFIVYIGGWLAFPRTVIFINLLISIICLILWRFIVYELYKKVIGKETLMVVGKEESCKRVIQNFEGIYNDMYEIKLVIYNNYFENVKMNSDKVDIVYLTTDVSSPEYNKILRFLTKNVKKTFLATNFENLLLLNSEVKNIKDETFLETTDFSIASEAGILKRFFDIILSLLAIILLLPVFIITTFLVKITSEGPILYKQTRITKGQQEFKILKFRTMQKNAESKSGPVLAQANDSRVTKVGKYLRALRIDELPQLFNVLKGDMSIVGPRPERPYFVDQFNEINDYYYLRHNVRAGITGYAQVYGKYITDFESKLNFDLIYVKRYSLLLDLQILLQTIRILFDKVSSEGLLTDEAGELEVFSGIEVYR